MNSSEAAADKQEMRAAPAGQQLDHRVVRGRQIVAQQRELAARLGERFPLTVTLLETLERSLAIIEDACRRNEVLITGAEEASSNAPLAAVPSSLEPARTPADTRAAVQQRRARNVDLVMKILRKGGYDCELARETLH